MASFGFVATKIAKLQAPSRMRFHRLHCGKNYAEEKEAVNAQLKAAWPHMALGWQLLNSVGPRHNGKRVSCACAQTHASTKPCILRTGRKL